MEDKNYKNFIEQDSMAEEYSLEEILAEYNSLDYDIPPEGGSLSERSKRIVMDAIDDAVTQADIDSIDDIVEDTVSQAMAESEPEPEPEPGPETEAGTEPGDGLEPEDELVDIPEEKSLSEYEIREMVDSDERERYASYDPEDELDPDPDPDSDEDEDVPARVRREKKKPSLPDKEKFLSPIIALLALVTHRRSRRVEADEGLATADSEDENIPEMAPEKASKFYGAQLPLLKLRARAATAVSLVMLYITLAFDSFLPLAGAMKGSTACAFVLLIMLLTVMLCGLDVFTAGIMSLVRGRPTADSLVSAGCVMAAADALIIGLDNTGAFGLPFCAISAVSMSFSIWGAYYTCIGLRRSFKLMGSKKAAAVTAEKGINPKGCALMKSARGITGAVRRSEMADLGEYVYNVLTPVVLACALVLGALASFFHGQSGAFIHCVSIMLSAASAFGAGICFALPFAISSKKLYSVGAAICGWGGVRDIGRSKNVVVSDSDIFPADSMEISAIRVLEGSMADKVISYTGSVVAASGNGMAGVFSALLERNGYSLCKVENFAANDGGGMTAVVCGENVMVGSTGFMNLMGIRVPQKIATRDTVFTAINGTLVGIFNIDYKVTAAVQDALGILQRTSREPVFALRDFNISPVAIENKFHLPADKINFPSFSERFRISGIRVTEDSPVSAVVCRDGVVPLVELSGRGARLYWGVAAGTAIAAAAAVLGLVIAFISCWQGNFEAASAAKALLWMALALLPQAGICFWLQR